MLPSHTHSYFRSGIFDLADNANYDLRIEGAAAGDRGVKSFAVADMNNDGKNDLVVNSTFADFNSRTDSGSLYIIYSTTLDDAIRRNGQHFKLDDNRNWNIRIDGATADDTLSRYFVVGDVDSDGKNDVVISAQNADFNSRSNSGSVYVLYNTLIDDYTGTGNTLDVITTTNYNLRYDGAVTNNAFGTGGHKIADLDNDGKNDLVLAAATADFNSRGNSGSVYIIYNTLIDDYAGTGNNIDLNTATNYNIRFDGEVATDNLGADHGAVGDFDNDGKNDLVIGCQICNPSSKTDAGSVYLFFNTLLDDYAGTGNTVNLATSTNYSARWEGAAASDKLFATGEAGDIDNDQRDDLVIGAYQSSFNSRSASGSLFIIPNTIISTYAGTTANQLNVATTSNYRLRIDGATAGDHLSSSMSYIQDLTQDGRNELIAFADNAAFHGRTTGGSGYIIDNATINQYTGTGSTLDLNNPSNFSTRFDGANALDSLGTPIMFKTGDLNNDGLQDIIMAAHDGGARTEGRGTGYMYIIYGRPNSTSSVVGTKQTVPDLRANEGGIIGKDNVVMVVEGETFPWDTYLYRERTEKSVVSPVVFGSGGFLFSQISPVYYTVWRAFSNDAKILTANKPFIVSLNYHT